MTSQNQKFHQIDSKRSKLKFNSTTTVSEDSGLSPFNMLKSTLFVVNDTIVDFYSQIYHVIDEVRKNPVIHDHLIEFWGKIEESNSNVRPVGFEIIHYCGFLFCWSRQNCRTNGCVVSAYLQHQITVCSIWYAVWSWTLCYQKRLIGPNPETFVLKVPNIIRKCISTFGSKLNKQKLKSSRGPNWTVQVDSNHQ